MQPPIIDRKVEQELFRKITSGETKEHMLFIAGQAGMGKSLLLLRVFPQICREHNIDATVLDLRSGIGGPLEVLIRISNALAHDKFPILYERMNTLTPKSVSIGGNYLLGSQKIQVALGGLNLENRQESNTWITDAFFLDLANVVKDKPFAIFIDSYERIESELADWFSNDFLSRAAQLKNLIVVVAGRALPAINIEWQDALLEIQIEPIVEESEWLSYAQQLAIPVTKDFIFGMSHALKGHPLSMVMALSAVSNKEGRE